MLSATRRLALTSSHKQFIKPQAALQLFSTTSKKTTIEKDENNIPIWENPILHKIDPALIEDPKFTHHPPNKIHEKVAYYAVQALRGTFDRVTKYKGKGMSKDHWLNRCLFLETVAGVPGMVGGMCRHLKSLRLMRRDNGWIHTLLEEAENERMHLLIFMNMRDPSFIFRASVVGAQMVFFSLFFTSYIISPKTCHRFVGYLEEEAVHTYTNILKDIETNKDLESWKTELAPLIARRYYKLADNASIYDMFKSVRADEANHRDVNHGFAALNQKSDVNPFIINVAPEAATPAPKKE